ncbi:GGDEF domain-containing protein [Paenibacillus silvisoli]|uniref:GGDEF domain-containing protein n=1 Tax=Paenibacillus silvisoli TaxID=3110539 RepID=UPI0028043234|nr:GGDEF domain-containing protein [Paenibacillus silvisoli]
MDEIGYGLLDKAMLHRLTERWHQGGIGIIALQLLGGTPAAAQEAITDWMREQRSIVWHYRMGTDRYFFFERTGSTEDRLEKLLRKGVDSLGRWLKDALSADREAQLRRANGKAAYAIGHAVAYPTGNARSIEASIYTAMKEAIASMIRQRIRDMRALRSRDRHTEDAQSAAVQAELNPLRDREEEQDVQEVHVRSMPSFASIGSLAKTALVVSKTALVSDLSRLFETNPHVQGAAVVEDGKPVGLVMKENMNQLLAGQFGLPLYWNRAISKIMDQEALAVDAELPVEQVVQLAMARDISRLYHLVLITRGGKLLGAASVRSILECMTQLRTEEAMKANPLTGLPGNASIQRELQRRIDLGKPFAIIYADLDYFKWFNDCFGFSQGDALIRFLASVLQEIEQLGGSKDSFIGHIGGDDFIVLTERQDAEKLCRLLLARFDSGVRGYYGDSDQPAGGVVDRNGTSVQQEGVSLSLSLLCWDGEKPVTPADISQAAARVKKQAKAIRGSACVAADVFGMHLGEGVT